MALDGMRTTIQENDLAVSYVSRACAQEFVEQLTRRR